MRKQLFFFIFLFFLLINFVSAQEDIKLMGKKGEVMVIPQECSSCSFVRLTSIQYPNSTEIYLDVAMQKNSSSFYYLFNNTQQIGVYNYCGYGDLNSVNTSFCYDFKITQLGYELTTEKAIVYLIFLIIFVLVFLGVFVFIGFLPAKNQVDEQGRILSISYLKYLRNILYVFEWILFIAIVYLFSNLGFAFLEEELFANVLFTLFKISMGITPLIFILWFVWIIVSMYHDKEFQKMLNRGMFPGQQL